MALGTTHPPHKELSLPITAWQELVFHPIPGNSPSETKGIRFILSSPRLAGVSLRLPDKLAFCVRDPGELHGFVSFFFLVVPHALPFSGACASYPAIFLSLFPFIFSSVVVVRLTAPKAKFLAEPHFSYKVNNGPVVIFFLLVSTRTYRT